MPWTQTYNHAGNFLWFLLTGWKYARQVWWQCLAVGFVYNFTAFVFAYLVSYSISGLVASFAALAACLFDSPVSSPPKV